MADQRVEIATLRTTNGQSRIELSRFLVPADVAGHCAAPVNVYGCLRMIFAIGDLDDTPERLRPHGAQLVGEVVRYEDAYWLCDIRGPGGLLVGLAQPLNQERPSTRLVGAGRRIKPSSRRNLV